MQWQRKRFVERLLAMERKRILCLGLVLAVLLAPSQVFGSPARSDLLVYTQFRKGNQSDIFMIRGSGGGLTRLTRSERNEVGAKFSPGGEQIAFVRQHGFGEGSTLWLMNRDGSSKERLASNASLGGELDWSPWGESLVYVASNGAQSDLVVIEVRSGSTRQLTHTPTENESEPDWSPDGSQIVYTRARVHAGNLIPRSDIWSVAASGGEPSQLTHHPRNDDLPSWSAGSSLIAFRSARSDSCDGCEDDITSNPYVMRSDGSEEVRLAEVSRSRTEEVIWHPSRNLVYFSIEYSGHSGARGVTDGEIYLVGGDGSGLRNVTSNRKDDFGPILSTDGQNLYLNRVKSGRHNLVRMNLAKSRRTLRRSRSPYDLSASTRL